MSPTSDAEQAAALLSDEVEKVNEETQGNGDVKPEDVTDPTASEVEHEPAHENESSVVDNATANTDNEIHADNQPAGDVDGGKPSDTKPEGDVETPAKPEAASAPTQSPKRPTPATGTAKAAASPVKAATGRAPGGLTQPVKKVISSGTFGAGSVKPSPPTVSKAASSSTTSKPPSATATLRKTASAASATTKPASTTTKAPTAKASTSPTKAMSTARTGNSSSLAPSSSTAIRRPSLPPKPPAARRPSTPDVSKAPARGASPVGSVRSTTSNNANRPRASVSDGLPAPARRTSLGPKPTPPTAAKPPLATRRPQPSIASLKDIKEDTAAVDELQKKLSAAQATLKEQLNKAASIQEEIESARVQSKNALAELGSKQTELTNLQEVKARIDEQFAAQSVLVQELRQQTSDINVELEDVKSKLNFAQADLASATKQSEEFENVIKNLTNEQEATKQEIDSLKTFVASNSEASAAAAVEHEALLKARADLEAIRAETAALGETHRAALEEAAARIKELETAAARTDELEAQLAELKAEKEENANRLSELEVEILELKEATESAQDQENQASVRMKVLEEQIAAAAAASEQALIEAKKRNEEHERALADAHRQHDEAVKAAGDEQDKLSAKLKELEDSLTAAVAQHEKALADAEAATVAHAQKVEEVEKLHSDKARDLSEEIERINKDLAGQEEQYAAKLNTVKEEHDKLLREAFEKAKTEAGDVHGKDLADLRTQSQAMIEQLNAGHKSYIEELKAEHQSLLDNNVKTLEKTNTSLSLELKATSDDLAKAKAALSASVPEMEALKKQLEDAEKAATAALESSASEQAAEVIRVRRELSAANDEVTALKEVLAVQKDSISEMSQNHSTELEVAAKARAEEVTKLRAEYEGEKAAHLQEKSDLAARVSDLEGELATVRATLEAQASAPASTKGNGIVPSPSASVSKEDLQKLHEAHNLKVHDLEAQHERSVQDLRGELDLAVTRTGELRNEVERRSMEINYLETESEEKDDTITRLKEDIAQLSEQLEKVKASA